MNSNEVQPHRMHKLLTVMGTKTVENPNTGVNRTVTADLFTLHYGDVKRTATQTYSLLGTKLEDTITVRIRHNMKVNENNKIKIDGVVYNIVSISRGVAERYINYDFLNLSVVNGKS